MLEMENNISINRIKNNNDDNNICNNILLVDDDKDILSLYSEYLTLKGFKTVPFDDPMDAITYIQDNLSEISLVITDYKMPTINGIELIKKIHAEQNGHPIKFILISAYLKDNLSSIVDNVNDDYCCNDNEKNVTRFESSLKIHRFLEKPVQLEKLNQAVCDLLYEEITIDNQRVR